MLCKISTGTGKGLCRKGLLVVAAVTLLLGACLTRGQAETGLKTVVPEQGSMTIQGEKDLSRLVVVGGGLAGCAAVLSAHQSASTLFQSTPWEIVLIEKMPKLGGNSAKASSGINALSPSSGDTAQRFQEDTIKSGGGRSQEDLVQTLVSHSEEAISLLTSLGVNLSKVTLLGGHTVPRSHTNPVGGNVGWSIMSVVMKKIRELDHVRILEGTTVEEVLINPLSGAVQGLLLSHEPEPKPEAHQPPPKAFPSASGSESLPPPPPPPSAVQAQSKLETLQAQAVILATGGYAASKELLRRYNPLAAELSTTNGPWAKGDGLALAAEAGGQLIDLEEVQIHPTGFVDPKDPSSPTKFLAPEKLRGVGGIMLSGEGRRFVNELGTRDAVSAALLSLQNRTAYLVLPSSSAEEYGQSAIDFYCAKNLMRKVTGISGVAGILNVNPTVLEQEFQQYDQALQGDVPDAWGKTSFPARLVNTTPESSFFLSLVTPVVHYTMGGVAIDSQSRALRRKDLTCANPDGKQPDGGCMEGQGGKEGRGDRRGGQEGERGGDGAEGEGKGRGEKGEEGKLAPIPGLYAAGEVAGGVHGRNRLGGNSLLECVVFGSIAGRHAASYCAEGADPWAAPELS